MYSSVYRDSIVSNNLLSLQQESDELSAGQ